MLNADERWWWWIAPEDLLVRLQEILILIAARICEQEACAAMLGVA